MKIISLFIIISVQFSIDCIGQQNDTTIYIDPEINPSLRYDTCSTLRNSIEKFFIDKYRMPAVLLDNSYIGNIYIEFIVERDSSLSNIRVIQGIDEPLDKSLIEAIKGIPKWIPGVEKGKIVRTRIVLPISINWLYGKTNQ